MKLAYWKVEGVKTCNSPAIFAAYGTTFKFRYTATAAAAAAATVYPIIVFT